MSPQDPILDNLRPIQLAPPLTRWGIDHTQVGPKIILNSVEYATGWLVSILVSSSDFSNTVPLLLYIIRTFGTPKQFIIDNARCFTGQDAVYFQELHKLTFTNTTPSRLQANGKVEQANRVLKIILTNAVLDNKDEPPAILLSKVVAMYIIFESPTGYCPFFKILGTQPPDNEILCPTNTKEATTREEEMWATELASLHPVPNSEELWK